MTRGPVPGCTRGGGPGGSPMERILVSEARRCAEEEEKKKMRGLTTVAVLMTALLVMAGTAAAKPGKPPKKPKTVDVQLLTVSDWHGQLTPVAGVGGAAFLKTYFDQARAANPNTLTF